MNRRALALLAILMGIFGIVAGRVLFQSKAPANPGPHRVTLTWHAPASSSDPSVLRYNVYRSEDGGQSYQQIAKGVNGTTYEDPNVVAKKTYFYEVSTVDPLKRESLRTPPVSTTVPDDH